MKNALSPDAGPILRNGSPAQLCRPPLDPSLPVQVKASHSLISTWVGIPATPRPRPNKIPKTPNLTTIDLHDVTKAKKVQGTLARPVDLQGPLGWSGTKRLRHHQSSKQSTYSSSSPCMYACMYAMYVCVRKSALIILTTIRVEKYEL